MFSFCSVWTTAFPKPAKGHLEVLNAAAATIRPEDLAGFYWVVLRDGNLTVAKLNYEPNVDPDEPWAWSVIGSEERWTPAEDFRNVLSKILMPDIRSALFDNKTPEA